MHGNIFQGFDNIWIEQPGHGNSSSSAVPGGGGGGDYGYRRDNSMDSSSNSGSGDSGGGGSSSAHHSNSNSKQSKSIHIRKMPSDHRWFSSSCGTILPTGDGRITALERESLMDRPPTPEVVEIVKKAGVVAYPEMDKKKKVEDLKEDGTKDDAGSTVKSKSDKGLVTQRVGSNAALGQDSSTVSVKDDVNNAETMEIDSTKTEAKSEEVSSSSSSKEKTKSAANSTEQSEPQLRDERPSPKVAAEIASKASPPGTGTMERTPAVVAPKPRNQTIESASVHVKTIEPVQQQSTSTISSQFNSNSGSASVVTSDQVLSASSGKLEIASDAPTNSDRPIGLTRDSSSGQAKIEVDPKRMMDGETKLCKMEATASERTDVTTSVPFEAARDDDPANSADKDGTAIETSKIDTLPHGHHGRDGITNATLGSTLQRKQPNSVEDAETTPPEDKGGAMRDAFAKTSPVGKTAMPPSHAGPATTTKQNLKDKDHSKTADGGATAEKALRVEEQPTPASKSYAANNSEDNNVVDESKFKPPSKPSVFDESNAKARPNPSVTKMTSSSASPAAWASIDSSDDEDVTLEELSRSEVETPDTTTTAMEESPRRTSSRINRKRKAAS